MSKQLDMYEVRVLPYNYAGMHGGIEKTYQITVVVNGEEKSMLKSVAADIPPYLTEIDILNRMTAEMLQALRKEQDQKAKEGLDE